MAQRRPADDEDDTLELTPDMETDEGPDDESEEGGEGEEERDQPDEGEAEPEEEVSEEEGPPIVAFEDEADEPAEGDSSVIRALRERNKTLARENAEMRAAQPEPQQIELPAKPTLADYDYDEEAYEAAVDEYKDLERRAGDAEAERKRQIQAAEREWQRDMDAYAAKRDKLNLPDFEDSAEAVKNALSLPQQATVIKAANDPAAFVYAVGRSEGRLAELAKIHDPIKLAAVIARMEGGIKVVKKRKAPAPDRPISGAGKMPGSTDKQLEKLEAEAERTGDRTQVLAYKKKLKARAKK